MNIYNCADKHRSGLLLIYTGHCKIYRFVKTYIYGLFSLFIAFYICNYCVAFWCDLCMTGISLSDNAFEILFYI